MDLDEVITRIGILRNRANLSARALSLEIGKNSGYINRLESKRDFVPTITVLLDIIEACGSTPEEFFYHDIFDYKTDKKFLDFIKPLSERQKNAIMNLYDSTGNNANDNNI
jgi:transcriptional regulator with XRE-family HTH domain